MTAIELLALEPVVWKDHIDELNAEEREILTSSLSHIMERAALARGYMDGAYLYGGGTHERGVKVANMLRVKIRKALSFAYPASGSVQF